MCPFEDLNISHCIVVGAEYYLVFHFENLMVLLGLWASCSWKWGEIKNKNLLKLVRNKLWATDGLVAPGIWVEIINKNLWKWVRNRLGSSDGLVVSGMWVEI